MLVGTGKGGGGRGSTNFLGFLEEVLGVLVILVVAGYAGDASGGHNVLRLTVIREHQICHKSTLVGKEGLPLGTHADDRACRRPDEYEAFFGESVGEDGVFAEETVS